MKFTILLVALVLSSFFVPVEMEASKQKKYAFKNDPIDVVIPSTAKDVAILNHCIDGIKKNCKNVRRVIVVSKERLTYNAEWFPEASYPFTKIDVGIALFTGNVEKGKAFTATAYWGGWYYQQLLKFYAPYVIPGISSNVLVLDSDTIFLRPVTFLNRHKAGNYNPGTEYVSSYFVHAARLVKGLKKLYKEHSGISHHMLFQRPVLDDLFQTVEKEHKKPFWVAFCNSVQLDNPCTQGASEYEIYFNFLFSRTKKATIRKLTWQNVSSIEALEEFRQRGYDYVSCHSWMREKINPNDIPFVHK